MKKVILLAFVTFLGMFAQAQDSTILFQNFNLCDSNILSGEHYPPGWSAYNVLGDQAWQCYSQYGVNNTPCLEMNGYQSSANWANEDWLFTPRLNLAGYSGSIYVNFFALWKYAGDSLHVMVSHNYVAGYNPDSTVYTWTELSHTGVMNSDTSVFHEFQVNLTPYKATPCFLGWKYTSTASDGSRWNIDSVFTSTTALTVNSGVKTVSDDKLPLIIIGTATTDEIHLAFNVLAGNYSIELYDMVGRNVYNENIIAKNGEQQYTLHNCTLVKGMYIIKLANDSADGVTKVFIQ